MAFFKSEHTLLIHYYFRLVNKARDKKHWYILPTTNFENFSAEEDSEQEKNQGNGLWTLGNCLIQHLTLHLTLINDHMALTANCLGFVKNSNSVSVSENWATGSCTESIVLFDMYMWVSDAMYVGNKPVSDIV